MNKLIIAAVIATLSGTAFAQGDSSTFIPYKHRDDVTATGQPQTRTTTYVSSAWEGYIPPRDRLNLNEDGYLGSQPQIGGSTDSGVWGYIPPRDRL